MCVCVCVCIHTKLYWSWPTTSLLLHQKYSPPNCRRPTKLLDPPDHHSSTASLPPSFLKVNGTWRMWWSQRDQHLCVHQRVHTSVHVCASENLSGSCAWCMTFFYTCVWVCCSVTLLAPLVFHHSPKWNFLFNIMLPLFSSLLFSLNTHISKQKSHISRFNWHTMIKPASTLTHRK